LLLGSALVGLAWLLPFTAAAEPPDGAARAGPKPEPGKAERGAARALFARRCAGCHDDDGTGSGMRQQASQIPDFTSERWQARRDDAQMVASILEGKGAKMPAFRGRLSEDQAKELVSLIRTFDPKYDPTKAGASMSSDEFGRRFRELEEELERLKKEYRKLTPADKS
jgi:mono/diheme cytochrome c family protein